MKHCKKTIALLLSVIMTLSLFSIVGFAEDGDTPTSFTVKFFDRSEVGFGTPQEVSSQTVTAGQSAEDPVAGKTEAQLKEVLHFPADPTDSFQKYGFTGWDKDFSNVQSELRIYPKFDQIPKMYHIIYHNWNGEELNSENCLIGEYLQERSIPERADDLAYFYTFKCWSLKQNIDPTKNEEDKKYMLDWTLGLQLPTDEALGQVKGQPDYIDLYGNDSSEPIPVHVYAYFIRGNFKEYPLSLTVVDQYNNRIAGADVQVLGANGYLLDQTVAQTDEEGNYTGRYKPAAGKTNSEGRLYMKLPYQTEYTIQVSYGDYAGAKIKKTSIGELQNTQGITIQLESPAQYNEQNKERCTCVCHTFLGGVWVTALNVLYYLFKVKYVCCYDMYATHGSKLSYGG